MFKIRINFKELKNINFEHIENYFGTHYRHSYAVTYYKIRDLEPSKEGHERFLALKWWFYRTYHCALEIVECVPLAQGDYVTSCSSDDDHWDHYEIPKSHGFGQQVWVTPKKTLLLKKIKGTRNTKSIVFAGLSESGKVIEITQTDD